MTLSSRSSNKRTRSPTSSDHPEAIIYCQAPKASDVVHHELDEPQRKRAVVATKLRFLEKMPPLRDYQRGRFGRRGGVDGGDGASAGWVQALGDSMEETSFVTCEAPTRAALVAPVSMSVDRRAYHTYIPAVPVPVARLHPGRVGIPSTRFTVGDEQDALRRRQRFALQVIRGGSKDDEARPATEGVAL